MQENEYYITTADKIYGMMRKSFIYVTMVSKKTFYYKFIDDWQLKEVDGKTKLKINKIETPNYRGKLIDETFFKKLNKKTLILSTDCPQ